MVNKHGMQVQAAHGGDLREEDPAQGEGVPEQLVGAAALLARRNNKLVHPESPFTRWMKTRKPHFDCPSFWLLIFHFQRIFSNAFYLCMSVTCLLISLV